MKWILGLFSVGSPWLWVAAAAVLLAIGAAGGVTVTKWWASARIAAAQLELADYQRQAVQVISERLVENSRLERANTQLSADVDINYQKGLADAQKRFQPLQDELATLRVLWGARRAPGGLQQPPAGPGAVPGGPDPAGGGPRRACTDEPGRIVEAAAGVIADLEACQRQSEQLAACRQYALSVRCQAH